MRHRTLVLVLAGIVVGGCGESPTNPDIAQPEFKVVPPTEGQVLLSGFLGMTVDPEGDVPGEITTDGRLYVDTEGTKKVPGQEICVNLSQLHGNVLHQDAYDLFVSQVATVDPPGDMTNVCSVVTMHTRDHSNDGKMPGIEEGTVEYSGGKIVLRDFATGRDSFEWRLIWDTAPDYAGGDANDLGHGVCIHRADTDTWHVYNDDHPEGDEFDDCATQGFAIDNVVELWRFYSERPNNFYQVHVADFVMPFGFTVTKQ